MNDHPDHPDHPDRVLGPNFTPFDALGLVASTELARRFYDHMDAHEPALVRLHRTDASGTAVSETVRERFTAFLVEWLGGPDDYSRANGHPRLRMRHARVDIDSAMRDAWLRCMNAALDHPSVGEDVRGYLRRRFAEVADFLRNKSDA